MYAIISTKTIMVKNDGIRHLLGRSSSFYEPFYPLHEFGKTVLCFSVCSVGVIVRRRQLVCFYLVLSVHTYGSHRHALSSHRETQWSCP